MLKKNQKKINQRIGLIFSMLLLMINTAGCGLKKNTNNNDIVPEASVKNVYSKNIIELPDNSEIQSISKSNTSGIYVVGKQSDNMQSVWYMNKNDEWERKYDINQVLNIDKEAYCKAYVSPDGEAFVLYNNEVDGKDEVKVSCSDLKLALINSKGENKEVKISFPELKSEVVEELEEYYLEKGDYKNTVDLVKFVEGRVLFSDINGNIYELNNDYSVSCIYENSELEYINEFSLYDNTLLMWDGEILYYEGLKTHDNEQAMCDKYQQFFMEAKQMGTSIKMYIENDMMYTISGDKISNVDMKSADFSVSKALGYETTEKILSYLVDDGKMYSLVKSEKENRNILYRYSDSMSLSDDDIQDKNGGNNKLKIWALRQDQTFNAAVRCFTDKYPNVEVEIEIGIVNPDSGITEEDAIKNLNTQIMSSEGPDVIYMDGLPFEKYFEDNKLYDLSEVIESIKSSGNYFDNILDSFKQDDKIYVVPSSVQLFAKVGTKENLIASENINDFIKFIEENNNNHNVIPSDLVNTYIIGTYYKDIRDDIKSGNINQEKIGDFFESSKKLINIQENDDRDFDINYMMFMNTYAGMYDGSFDFVCFNCGDLIAYDSSYDNMASKMNGIVEVPAADFSDRYIARECMAISAEASNIDMAKEYIKIALSEECQSNYGGAMAFSVNKDSLRKYNKEMYSMTHNRGEDMATGTDLLESDKTEIDIDTQIENVISKIELMDKALYFDNTLDQMVLDELSQFVRGSKDKESSVSSLSEKIKIYMSE
ncbi:MAG: hypothetical protein PUG10_03355 [Lachnospiraceae bacterium]|nr:hypothetical protein [Lachnospiraceae bacterium]